MTYRQRREARVERLTEWSAKNQDKADATLGRARQMGDGIPFGQPVMDARDARYRERIRSTYGRGFETAEKARAQASRAAGIEAQLAGAIYSDDGDAIERLAERIGKLEAERDRIKAYNASCRKGQRDVSLLDERQQADLASTAKVAAYSLGKGGAMPAYHLSNLSGNIKRQRDRFAQLKRERGIA